MQKKERKGMGFRPTAALLAVLLLLAIVALSLSSCDILAGTLGTPGTTTATTPATTTRAPADAYQSVDFDQYLTPELPSGAGTYIYTAKTASPSVVSILTEAIVYNPYNGSYVESGAGSGVVCYVDTEGGNTYIITNNHVVEGYSGIKVYMNGSDVAYPATLIGTDWQTDIAVIRVASTDFVAANFGNSVQLAVGQEVAAIGNPLGLLGGTMTDGRISALDRKIEVEGVPMSLIQHSAAVSPGNSGGGLFNLYGQCIGIVNAKSTGSGVEGLGFAIPIDLALDRATELIEAGYIAGTPYLGITYSVGTNGVTVSSYLYNSELEATNQNTLAQGDILVSLNNYVIEDVSDVRAVLSRCEVGDTVTAVLQQRVGYGYYKQYTVNLKVHEYIPEGVTVDTPEPDVSGGNMSFE